MGTVSEETGPNAADIFLHGARFCRAFTHLSNSARSPSEAKVFTAPVMVMSAFASEIFLKCLVCVETGKVAQGHQLLALFDALSRPTQEKIERRWNDEIVPLRAVFWNKAEKEAGKKIDRDFREALTAGSNAFIQMRYRYEIALGRQAHFWITDLPIALERVIFEIKPEWRKLTWDDQTLPTSLVS